MICNLLSGLQASAEQGHLGNWEIWTALGGMIRSEESAEGQGESWPSMALILLLYWKAQQ